MRFLRQARYMLSWVPVLWSDVNWDWTAIFIILEFKLRKMEECIRNGYHVGREKDADQILECAALCRRMHGDYYPWAQDEGLFFPNLKQWCVGEEFNGCAYADWMFQQDLERFCMLMKKYVRNWWT